MEEPHMSANGVDLMELYEKALAMAEAEDFLSAPDQERLGRSLAEVLAELRRYRRQRQQVRTAEQRTALSHQKASLFYGLTPGEAVESRLAAKEPSRLQQPVLATEIAAGPERPAQAPPEKKLPSGRMPLAGQQALGLWIAHAQPR
jgi:hypothetical protein